MSLAEALWAARVGGTQVRVARAERPHDVADAYRVQAEIGAAAGVTPIGWKIGATTQAALDALGFAEPFFGPLYARFAYDSGTEVPIVAAHGPAIETEFVVGLARSLPARSEPYSRVEVEAAIGWVGPGLEIVGTRLASGFSGAGNLLVADGGANMGFVQGPKDSAWRELDLSAHPATLYVADEEVARGDSGMLLFGNTVGAVVWLANCPFMAPRGLRAGDVITTGSCTGMIPIAVGDQARADFGALGTVAARFVAG